MEFGLGKRWIAMHLPTIQAQNRRFSRAIFFHIWLRQAKVADDVNGVECTAIYLEMNIEFNRSWLKMLNILVPIGWGPSASRTPAHKWRTRVWGSTLCVAVSTRGIPVFVPGLWQL